MPAPTTTTLPALATPAEALRVGSRTFDWVDSTRATPANDRYRARSGRELVTTIWYPAVGSSSRFVHARAAADHAHGRFPILLLAHGHGGEPVDYTPDALNWASRGYVVVAPAFPLSRRRALGGPTYADLANQPGDLSFVLTRVLADNVDPSSWLYHLVDARRVGAVGHSMGAWTVLALVGNTCCRDRRVTAAVIDAGEMAPAFKTKFFAKGSAPVLFVNARDDATVPYAAGEQAYLAAPKPKYMLTLPSGGHITPYFGPKTPVGATVLQVTNDFLDRYVRTIRSVAIVSPDLRYGTLTSRR